MLNETIELRDVINEPSVIFQVYIAQGLIFLLFLFMAYKVLKRGTTRLNLIFSGFYISSSVGFFINFIFVLFLNETLVWVLYLLTMYFIHFSLIFILVFVLIIKNEEKYSKEKQNVIIIGFAIFLIGMFLIPRGLLINHQTQWHPIYSDPLIIFFLAAVTIPLIPALYSSIKVYNLIESEELKKKWRFFIIGIIFVGIFAYLTLITYKLTQGIIILAYSFISFILIILSSYFLYHGMVRKL